MPYSVGAGNYFDIALSSDGSKALSVFSSLTNLKVSSGYSTDQGQTWLLNSDFTDGLGASVAISSSGDIAYGAWYDLTNHVIAAYSTDHGMTWINQTSVDPINIGADPSIATNSDGSKAYIVWQDIVSSTIYSAYSVDQGMTWINQTAVGTGSSPEIAIDSTGDKAYAGWTSLSNKVLTAYSTNHGLTWTPTTSVINGTHGSITVSSDGEQANIAWVDAGSTYSAYSTNHGQTWTLQTLAQPGVDPSIAMNSYDGIVVCVSRDIGPSSTIYSSYSIDYGATWTPIADPGAATGASPVVALTSDGTLGIRLWYTPGLPGAIFSAFSDFAPAPPPPPPTTVLTVAAAQNQFRSLFQKDVVNELSWNALPEAIRYRVYQGGLGNLIFEGQGTSFDQHGIKKSATTTYYVTWMNVLNEESPPAIVTLP